MTRVSENTTKNNVTMTIVARIVAAFEASDETKTKKFFAKEKTTTERAVNKLNKNIITAKDDCKEELEAIDEQIEDKIAALEDAKIAIKPEDIATNEVMAEFNVEYWKNIGIADARVKTLRQDKIDTQDKWDSKIKEINDQVKIYENRLSIING